MITAYKFRLFPKHKHIHLMTRVLDAHRTLYNAALEQRRITWQEHRIGLTYSKQAAELKDLRATTDELHGTNYSSCQQTLRRLDKSFQNFFRRVQNGETPGYPRFKSRERFNTVEFVYGDGCKINQQYVYFQHIGNVKIVLHRPVEGTIKRLALTRRADKWFLIVTCENGSVPLPAPLSDVVGIDVGLESFATLSTGEQIENPRFLRCDEKDLKRAQRKLSKCAKGTKERQYAKKVVSRIHERIANRRSNFAHQESRKLAKRFGFIAFEDLNIKGMLQNHSLAKSISDVAWNQLITYTTYKAAKAGGCVVQVDPRGTSQICSRCGEKVVKTLATRVHHCKCGLILHRDHNAALNILRLGLQSGGIPNKGWGESEEAARL